MYGYFIMVALFVIAETNFATIIDCLKKGCSLFEYGKIIIMLDLIWGSFFSSSVRRCRRTPLQDIQDLGFYFSALIDPVSLQLQSFFSLNRQSGTDDDHSPCGKGQGFLGTDRSPFL